MLPKRPIRVSEAISRYGIINSVLIAFEIRIIIERDFPKDAHIELLVESRAVLMLFEPPYPALK